MIYWLLLTPDHSNQEPERRKVDLPYDGAPHAIAQGTCPHCSKSPFRVAGGNMRDHSEHGVKVSDGACADCRKPIGQLFAKTVTLFGHDEDQRVLAGPWKVF